MRTTATPSPALFDDTCTRDTTRVALERAAVVAEAWSWVGTPFHHGSALKGVGVDCAQLLIECYYVAGIDRPAVGVYAPDWFLHDDGAALDRLSDWVARYCVPTAVPRPGDLALFRYGRAVSHGAIVVTTDTVLHAFAGLGVVQGSLAPTHDLFPRLAGYWTPTRWAEGGLG